MTRQTDYQGAQPKVELKVLPAGADGEGPAAPPRHSLMRHTDDERNETAPPIADSDVAAEKTVDREAQRAEQMLANSERTASGDNGESPTRSSEDGDSPRLSRSERRRIEESKKRAPHWQCTSLKTSRQVPRMKRTLSRRRIRCKGKCSRAKTGWCRPVISERGKGTWPQPNDPWRGLAVSATDLGPTARFLAGENGVQHPHRGDCIVNAVIQRFVAQHGLGEILCLFGILVAGWDDFAAGQ